MQIQRPTNALRDAYDAGYAAFFVFDTAKDRNGKMIGSPTNPYYKDSLVYKEWERGNNAAYFDNKKGAVV